MKGGHVKVTHHLAVGSAHPCAAGAGITLGANVITMFFALNARGAEQGDAIVTTLLVAAGFGTDTIDQPTITIWGWLSGNSRVE
jgi:hypothetical protein